MDMEAKIPNSAGGNGSGERTLRIRIGLGITVIGYLVLLIGAKPALFGLDRSPVIGFVQLAVFLVGLAIVCIGGFISVNTQWAGTPKTIIGDIGMRLVATGYVISVATGMADVFGIGNQPWPEVPYFGPWQAVGVMIGEATIAVGFLLMIPYQEAKLDEASEPEG